MSNVKALESLTGSISEEVSLQGALSCDKSLSGNLSVVTEFDKYTGEYSVIPKAKDAQILNTANKVMSEDVVIAKIPYWETGNASDGKTAYIAKEV